MKINEFYVGQVVINKKDEKFRISVVRYVGIDYVILEIFNSDSTSFVEKLQDNNENKINDINSLCSVDIKKINNIKEKIQDISLKIKVIIQDDENKDISLKIIKELLGFNE